MDGKTKDGLMDGNVEFKLGVTDIRAKAMEFNLENGYGTLLDAKGTFGENFNFSAKKLQRTGENSFKITDGLLTSCPPENREWVFRAGSASVQLEGMAYLKDVSLRFYDVPVFYFPFWFAPAVTKRSSGFLMPTVGYSSTSGAFMNNSYFWAISEQDDATFYIDAMSLRGTHEGVEYRYAYAERTRGQMNADYINDALLSDRLYSVKYNHAQQLSDHFDSMANLDMESRISYSKEFSNDQFLRTRVYTDSSLNLRGGQESWFASLTGRDQRGVEETPTEILSKVPEFKTSVLPHSFYGSPIYLAGDASATSYFSSPLAGNQTVQRSDIQPEISIPFGFTSLFNVTPWGRWHTTTYSRDAAGLAPVTTNYYSTGGNIEGPRFYRTFETPQNAYKHLITPKLDYTYVPGYEMDGVDRKNTVRLDAIDYSTPQSLLTFTLINRVFSRTGDKETLWLDLHQSYDFNEAARTDTTLIYPYRPLQMYMKSRISDTLLFNMDTAYNHYLGTPDTIDQELGLAAPNSAFYFSYDRRYSRQQQLKAPDGTVTWSGSPTIFSSGLIGFHISSRVSAEASAIYDEYQQQYTGTLFILKYQSCCWGVSLEAGTKPRTIALPDGTLRQENETRVYLSLNLKGIGDIGEKPTALLERKI